LPDNWVAEGCIGDSLRQATRVRFNGRMDRTTNVSTLAIHAPHKGEGILHITPRH